tara:strand:+ start:187 stop:459 length:273 start_codon:yes stop_codon:yes gene_type:complete
MNANKRECLKKKRWPTEFRVEMKKQSIFSCFLRKRRAMAKKIAGSEISDIHPRIEMAAFICACSRPFADFRIQPDKTRGLPSRKRRVIDH